MHDAICCHPHLPVSHIRQSLEQDLSKCESTRNQTALPGWASPGREGGLGGKQQRGDPRAFLGGAQTRLSVGIALPDTTELLQGSGHLLLSGRV